MNLMSSLSLKKFLNKNQSARGDTMRKSFEGDIVYSNENGISEVLFQEIRGEQTFVTCSGPLSAHEDDRTTFDALPEFELMRGLSAKEIKERGLTPCKGTEGDPWSCESRTPHHIVIKTNDGFAIDIDYDETDSCVDISVLPSVMSENEKFTPSAIKVDAPAKIGRALWLYINEAETNRAHVILSSGVEIHLNLTHEGVIIDVWDDLDAEGECIDTLAVCMDDLIN